MEQKDFNAVHVTIDPSRLMIILDYGTVNSQGGITALYYGADSEQIAPFYFWSCRAYLACVGGIEAGGRCQFGSWMMFVCFSFFL